MCYTKNRKSVFGSVLNTIDLNNNKNDSKRNPEWFKYATRESFLNKKIKINEVSENKKVLNISDYKCCNRNHISRFNTKERNDVFNYFN